eukprot:SM000072S21162  [mRNA]  locus=s72:29135:33045:- [translate_table: standard]
MQALQLRLPAAALPAAKSRRNEQPPAHRCSPPPPAQLGGRLEARPGLFCSARRQRARPPKLVRDAGTSVGTTVPDLTAYVTQGPLWPKLGSQPDDMERQLLSLPLLAVGDGLLRSEMDKWQQLGQQLAEQLGFDKGGALDESQRCRLYRYYVPAFFWCLKQLEQYQQQRTGGAAADRRPLVVGISAPQGCGKSTLVESLEYLFNKSSRKAASISIDDFYLTAADQEALRDANPGNQLLELRGNAGSHDLALGMATLKALKGLSKPGDKFRVPRYNKSARAGKGDRADASTWPEVEGPLEIVLFEGWMLGFEPLPSEKVASLVVVNDKLAEYAAWHNEVDAWIIIEVDDPNWVFDWRLQAEVVMRNKGKPGMTDEQVADFVSTYMPAYKAYLPQLYSRGPQHADSNKTLKLVIDKGRNPVG